MNFSTVYQRAHNCVGSERPGARALQNYLLAEIDKLPGCETLDSGIYNCRNIGGTGQKSVHSEGRAGDVGVRTPEGMWPTKELSEPGIWEWCDRLIEHADQLGIQYVIYARKHRRSGDPAWRPYAGQSPHFDHIHWEITREAAEALTPEYVATVLAEGDELMATPHLEVPAAIDAIDKMYQRYATKRPATKRYPESPEALEYQLDRYFASDDPAAFLVKLGKELRDE